MTNDRPISDAIDPELTAELTSHGDALTKVGIGLAAASIPVALGVLSRDAFGQAIPQQIRDVLNFALTLEYLEAEYYQKGLAASGLIPAQTRPIFQQISKHEDAHVALLKSVLGASAVAKPTFDFTSKGTFAPFTDYPTFLALSQGFEDTGVRAYKGQAAKLMENDAILTTALQIHSVEARHAAQVRRLRGPGNAMPDAWITLNQTNVPALQPVYNGEENVVQGGVDLTTISPLSREIITEAFDEPLTMEQVLAIAGLFLA